MPWAICRRSSSPIIRPRSRPACRRSPRVFLIAPAALPPRPEPCLSDAVRVRVPCCVGVHPWRFRRADLAARGQRLGGHDLQFTSSSGYTPARSTKRSWSLRPSPRSSETASSRAGAVHRPALRRQQPRHHHHSVLEFLPVSGHSALPSAPPIRRFYPGGNYSAAGGSRAAMFLVR